MSSHAKPLRKAKSVERDGAKRRFCPRGVLVYLGVLFLDIAVICVTIAIESRELGTGLGFFTGIVCICSMYFLVNALGFGIAYAIAGRPYAFFGSLVASTCIVGLMYIPQFFDSTGPSRIENGAILGFLLAAVVVGWLGSYRQAYKLKSLPGD